MINPSNKVLKAFNIRQKSKKINGGQGNTFKCIVIFKKQFI